MDGIEIFGNVSRGQEFVEDLPKKNFLFSFVISYTETSLIPGITFAGSEPQLIQFTPPADAEFLHYGYCKTIDKIPMTPDGKPTPALLTKVALESASIPHVVVNAGSKIEPKLPFIHTGIKPGQNITQGPAMSYDQVLHAIDFGRIVGRTLSSLSDCLIIGESIPGGTTTALALLRGLGIRSRTSSSIPQNPLSLKDKIVENSLRRFRANDPFVIASQVGDPMIPFVAGMLSAASDINKVLLGGGTQMAAVLALANSVGFNASNTAVGTTSYIIDDNTSNFLDMIKSISDIPVLAVNPLLENSKFEGLKAFSEGFVKEGVGAGASIISSLLKTGNSRQRLLELIEEEYQKIFASHL